MRVEPRISELCSQASAADDPEEVRRLLGELREALREQLFHLRKTVAQTFPLSGTSRAAIDEIAFADYGQLPFIRTRSGPERLVRG